MLTWALVLIVIGGLVIAGAVALRMRQRVAADDGVRGFEADDDMDGSTGDPMIVFDDEVQGAVPLPGAVIESGARAGAGAAGDVPQPTWPQRVQRNAGVLDRDARLRLLSDLGMLRAGWCVPILEQAVAEETDGEVRAAAVAALARCGARAAPAGDVVAVSRNGSVKGEERSPSV